MSSRSDNATVSAARQQESITANEQANGRLADRKYCKSRPCLIASSCVSSSFRGLLASGSVHLVRGSLDPGRPVYSHLPASAGGQSRTPFSVNWVTLRAARCSDRRAAAIVSASAQNIFILLGHIDSNVYVYRNGAGQGVSKDATPPGNP